MNVEAIEKAIRRQREEIMMAWRFDDWILAVRRDGCYLKLPHGSPIISLVVNGKLPNAHKLMIGVVHGY
jgi:hypothetical protein